MIKLFKAKSLKKTRESLTSNVEEKTREKAILKEGIGVNGKLTCTKRTGTRGFSFATYTPSKMGFAVRGSKKQRGRSMVEMLGVLAIIGVLSIGGIQGYTMAMRKYRANEILNVVQKYAMMVYSSCQQQMINNPLKYDDSYGYVGAGIQDDRGMKGYWICERVLFTDSGLGSIPNGVVSIGTLTPDSDYTALASPWNGYTNSSVRILSRSSGDIVSVPVLFNDKALCETVLAITGETLSADGREDYLCGKYWDGDRYMLDPINVVMN